MWMYLMIKYQIIQENPAPDDTVSSFGLFTKAF